jgi:prepilin-type N-terminal cleavage/methylation domain-containing protein
MVRLRKLSNRARRAFSLLELLAVVTLMGILAAIIIPRIGGSTLRAKIHACHQYRAEINAAAERYYFDHGSPPSRLSDLELNQEYFPDKAPYCPVTKEAYTLDATTGRVVGHDH